MLNSLCKCHECKKNNYEKVFVKESIHHKDFWFSEPKHFILTSTKDKNNKKIMLNLNAAIYTKCQ